MLHLIGVYDYTVILTYMSLISSLIGITQSIHGAYKTAIFFLALAGLCDAFDGRVARTKSDRTEDEKNFGIQLDSLCDIVSFGVFPALICYLLGVRGALGLTVVCFYCVCALIRLAYFNVLESNRQKEEGGANKVYHGLPVTSVSIILPLTFWIQFIIPPFAFIVVLHVMLVTMGLLFILDFPVKKPSMKMLLIMVAIGAVTVAAIFAFTRYRLPKLNDTTNPITEEILVVMDENSQYINDEEFPGAVADTPVSAG